MIFKVKGEQPIHHEVIEWSMKMNCYGNVEIYANGHKAITLDRNEKFLISRSVVPESLGLPLTRDGYVRYSTDVD